MNAEHKQIISDFVEWLKAKGYKARGIETKEWGARSFFEYAGDYGVDVKRAGIRDAENYREHLRLAIDAEGKPRYNPRTINGKIGYARLLFRFLIETGRALCNPFGDIERMKESQNLPKNILSIEETGKFLDSIKVNDRDDFKFKVIIELLYSTGARVSEIEHLKREDIRITEGYITIRDDKERQERRCPLTEYSKEILAIYLEGTRNDPVFAHGANRTLNAWINNRLKSLAAREGLPRITCHGIRHTIATHLLKSGADIREVQEFLGHRRIKNTEVYTRVFPDDLRGVIERTHPRERRTGTDEAENDRAPV